MECDICRRGYDAKRLPFLCAVDARNKLYNGRIQSVQVALENEKLQQQVQEGSGDMGTLEEAESRLAQQRLAEDRTEKILAAAKKLRDDIEAAKEKLQAKKVAISKRRADLTAVSGGLVERRIKQEQDIGLAARDTQFRWSQSAEATANQRAFLCSGAMKLYGLKRTRKGSSGRYDYQIGKIPLVDPSSMDSLSPEVISTSLAHVAHVVVLVARYLCIRMPAEITLPHKDYPKPTIFNLNSSYQGITAMFPSPSKSSLSSSQSREFDYRAPRPRPLFTTKPLKQLAKEDPSAYSFFLEGVTLLAYDIAWLCCCQGVFAGSTSNFDDICNMGRNLYALLLDAQSHDWDTVGLKGFEAEDDGDKASLFGRYSHGAAYYFLGTTFGAEFTRGFKLPSPMKLADRLKKRLTGDVPAADWEVVDDDAWKVEEGTPSDQTLAERPKETDDSITRTGSNGWAKVKLR